MAGSVAARAGTEYSEVADYQPAEPGGTVRVFQGVTREGRVIASRTPPAGAGLAPLTVELVLGDKTTPLAGPMDNRQVVAAASGGSTIAWMQTSSTSMYEADWEIYASTGGGPGRLLAASGQVTRGKVPRTPEYVPISTDGDTVYWTSPRVEGGRGRADILAMAAAPGADRTPRVLVHDAKLPVAVGGELFYVRSRDVDPQLAGPAQVRARTLKDGRDRLVGEVPARAGDGIGAMCVSTDRLAWTSAGRDGRDVLTVTERGTRMSKTVKLNNSAGSTSLACGDGFVAWGGGSGSGDSTQYLCRSVDSAPSRIGTAPGRAVVHAAGRYVAWWHAAEGNDLSALKVARVRT
ncbi:hypothetical protein [Terrabacter sp. NPDC080008]|uniref:hypothetical protein n=1 Tax=Terrabacter sp. NPDC080008 TaxID=3155176 RepID=UPI0034508390